MSFYIGRFGRYIPQNRYYSQHIVHSVQTRLSSNSDGLPQSDMKEEEFGKVEPSCGIVPENLLECR